MAVRIGPTIAIDGMSSYKKDIQTLISKGKALDSEMKVVKSAWDANTTAQQKNADKAKVLTEQIANQQQLVAQLTAVVEAASQSESVNEDQLAKWTTQLNNATAELNTMQAELNGTTPELDEMADGMDETADAADNAGQSALTFGDILKANVIADFIVEGVKKLASAMWDAAKGVAQAYGDTVNWADDLLTLSTNTGIATDKLQAFEYMAGLTDTDVGDITGALKKMIPKMADAAGKTDDADNAFSQLGVSVTDANGDLRDNYDVFLETIDALGQVENATERDALSMEIFGKNAQELNSLIAVGSEGIEEYAQEAEDLGYILDTETLQSLGEMKDVQDRLNGALETIKKQGAAAFTPMIETLANEAIPKIQEYVGQIDQLFSGEISLDDFIESITNDIAESGDEFGEIGSQIVSALVTAIKQAPNIVEAATAFIDSFVGELSADAGQNGKDIGNSLGETISAVADSIGELTEPITKLAVEFTTQFAAAIIANAPQIIVDSLVSAIDSAGGLVSGIAEGLLNAFGLTDKMRDEGTKAAEDLSSGISQGSTKHVKPAAEETAETVEEPIDGVVNESFTWGADAGQGLADGLRSKKYEVGAAAEEVAAVMSGPLHFSRPDYGPLRDYETWMPDFIGGMARGIRDNAYKLREAVGSMAGDVNVAMNGGGGSSVVNLTVTNPSEAYTEYLFNKFNVRLAGVVG